MIDWNKPIQLIGGNPARLVCKDKKQPKGELANIILYQTGDAEYMMLVDNKGICISGGQKGVLSIVNAPETNTRYIVARSKDGYKNLAMAKKYAALEDIVLKIESVEGKIVSIEKVQ